MKAFSKLNKRNILLVVALSGLMLAGSLSAFAVPVGQVARDRTGKTITAQCCVLFGPFVQIPEPSKVTPVLVTWGVDYSVSDTFQVGLSVNGGPCVAYGPFVMEQPVLIGGSDGTTVSETYQWIVFPSDGLGLGGNTFHVCGGGFSQSATINIGFNTLTVQISK